MRWAGGPFVACALVAFANDARAEDGDAGSVDRLDVRTEPLRLGLTRDRFAFSPRMLGCDGVEPSRDKWLTQELTPHFHFLAIMRSGCGVETGGGGGLTYSAEIRPDVFFVASIGAWLTPPIDEVRKMKLDAIGRLDLVIRLKQGRSINLGLFANATTIGFGFGGVF